jgi:hypothetical protein
VVCLVNQNAEICEKEEEVKRSSDPKCENGGVIEAPMEKKNSSSCKHEIEEPQYVQDPELCNLQVVRKYQSLLP